MKNKDLKRAYYFPEKTVADQDYFEIPESRLIDLGITTVKKNLDLTHKRLDLGLLEDEGLNLHKKETVVFNLPTGTGKSETFYDLVKKYSEKGGNLVLVCSPFVKLVNKDVDALRGRGLDVFSYIDLNPKDFNFQSAWRAVIGRAEVPIHVMTISCLMRDSGDTVFEQAFEKGRYLDDLIEAAKRNGKKVVIFIDELHESVRKFTRMHLPYLVQWKGVVEKIFVASATHTPASFAIIQHLGRITDNSITIYESKRTPPATSAAKLFIHLTHKAYNKKDLSGLNILAEILEKVGDRPVHILCAHRDVAEAIVKSKKEKTPLGSFQGRFKLLVGGAQEAFNPVNNSIGTTFKTGVNITDGNAVFILILPANYLTEYNGLFTDGVSSIIQAMGRLREGGTCHVVMLPPSRLINGTKLITKTGKSFSASKEPEQWFSQNQLLELAIENYQRKIESIK